MTPHRNSPARAAMLADRATAQLSRRGGIGLLVDINGHIVSPKIRRSTRGQRTASWLTKAHTPSRIRDMNEANA